MARGIGWAGLVAVALIAGCHPMRPGGQTVAVVNGAPITNSDIDLELSLLPAEAGRRARPQVLQALIDRKLMVEEARARGVDHAVQFVRMDRRNREMLLAQFAADVVAARAATASGREVADRLARRSEMGAQRRLLTVDVLSFPLSSGVQREIAGLRERAALQRALARHGVSASITRQAWDSATISPDQAGQVAGLAPGQMAIHREGDRAVAIVVVAAQAAPLDPASAARMAQAQLIADHKAEAIARHSAALHAGATISVGL
jgi:hypothetical protein